MLDLQVYRRKRVRHGSWGWNELPWDFPSLSLCAGSPAAPCLKPPLLWWYHLSAVQIRGSCSSPCVSSQHSYPRSERREACERQTQRQPARQVDKHHSTITLKTHKRTHSQEKTKWESSNGSSRKSWQQRTVIGRHEKYIFEKS